MKLDAIKKRMNILGYDVSTFENAVDAVNYLDSQINHKTVGFGGSVTLEQIGLYDVLNKHNQVFWHQGIADTEKSKKIRLQANAAEIYISSVNGIAETGEIINIDGNCNRVSAIFYGHERVYLIIGKNKIEKNYESALYRARNVAAPLNARRLKVNTPCAITGERCYNCQSPERICRGLSVLWQKPITGDFEILLINENLGY